MYLIGCLQAQEELRKLSAENSQLMQENARLVADLESAESDIEKLKGIAKKYKQVQAYCVAAILSRNAHVDNVFLMTAV